MKSIGKIWKYHNAYGHDTDCVNLTSELQRLMEKGGLPKKYYEKTDDKGNINRLKRAYGRFHLDAKGNHDDYRKLPPQPAPQAEPFPPGQTIPMIYGGPTGGDSHNAWRNERRMIQNEHGQIKSMAKGITV
ncbi:hypothetical protein CASFOL_022762 [Castilleja foliolosa]|uniref:Uncharacterized protein n=1 Tax=Castilleja foliolosa TaxID=1961234 RepID=A0ABD3CX51_9LAMI